jgi:hypothetical protein
MRRKAMGATLLAVAALMLAYAAYAVLIDLRSVDVDQLGGTPTVNVNCPAADPCQISRVKWVLMSSYPYLVDQVRVDWQTRETSGASYTVYVTLFDNSGNPISSGFATQPASSLPVSTYVDVSDADPAQVYKVQIVIVQN